MTQPNLDPSAPFRHALIDVHSNYRSQRLTHEAPDELVSDAVTPKVLRPHLVRSGFFLTLFLFTWALLFLVSFFALAANAANAFNGGSGDTPFTGLVYLVLFLQLLVVAAWIVALCLPIREPIAEYGLLIEGRGPASGVAEAWDGNTNRARQCPCSTDS